MMVYQIFFAEIITSSAIQLLDPVETFKKHVLAPRARTQEHMNLHFRGTEIFLAERYTVRNHWNSRHRFCFSISISPHFCLPSHWADPHFSNSLNIELDKDRLFVCLVLPPLSSSAFYCSNCAWVELLCGSI
jgi:hypothetical protein